MITLYDMGPCSLPGIKGYSPYVRSIIYTLKYKHLPFNVSLVNWATIESTAKSIGAPPTSTKLDGSPKYTVPFMHDTTTGRSVSDSLNIAEYLDQTYPNTRRVVPLGTRVFQAVFCDAIPHKFTPMIPVVLPAMRELGTPEVKQSLKEVYGEDPLFSLSPEEKEDAWNKGKQGFDELSRGYKEGDLFTMGDEPVFVDFLLAGTFWEQMLALGKESAEWKKMATWMGGRVGRLVQRAESMMTV
ncbi:hypothetical protein Moror_7882 [Moniliophthora roreri MCA 2997]|uniref:Uncharacterized protein n=2 Tax=Moniliophthora roreri TaxID=221103 RepID=V2XC18_MONRO|nr:hypothetical protein Moror_7882 [Moniliophthora roreri MCA 2997]